MINAPDYIAEQALIIMYRAITDALATKRPENTGESSVFEDSSDGFSGISEEFPDNVS